MSDAAEEPTVGDEGWFPVSRRIVRSSRWFREAPETIKLLFFVIEYATNPMNPVPGTILLGLSAVAAMSGLPAEKAEMALASLCAADSESRSKENNGAVLDRIDGGYRLVNFDMYNPGLIEKSAVKRKERRERAGRIAAQARWEKARAAVKVLGPGDIPEVE